ncbi:unnamed protein product, partial [Candidula unifasciata]
MSSELAYEASDEASENELLERSLSVWKGWTSIEWEDFAPTALDIHTACSIGHYEWVRSIILKGEDPALDRRNHGGWTPLMYACYIGHDNIVNLLINAGCNMNMKNSRGHTPLMLAASCGNESVARTLVRRGAELELTDKTGWTALFHATYAGHQNFVAFLLEAGANKDAIEASSGMTPFMEAAAAGHEIIVQLFLQHGVNTNAKAHNGVMARSLALMNGHMKVISLIDNHVMPVSCLRPQPGPDCYRTSKETQSRKQLPSVHSRRLKPQSPSIREGPEAIARMIDRTRNKDTVAYPNLLVPKGYVTFPINGADKEDTKMSYRDVTSPINPEDYKDSSGSRAMSDLEDFNDDSNAFTKTGAITIRSSSSSSGGLVAALGLSREGSLDSDDSHLFEPAATSSDDAAEFPDITFENNRGRTVSLNENNLCTDEKPYLGDSRLNARVCDKENIKPDCNMVQLSAVKTGKSGFNLIENGGGSLRQNSLVASPVQDYFPLHSPVPGGDTAAPSDKCQGHQHESSMPSSSHQSPLTASDSCLSLPKDNMSQVEIVNRFLRNLTVNNPETAPDQHRWADEPSSKQTLCDYRETEAHLMENLTTTASEVIPGMRRYSLSACADSKIVEYKCKDGTLNVESAHSSIAGSSLDVPQTEFFDGLLEPSLKDTGSVDVQGQPFPRSKPSHHQRDPFDHKSNQPWAQHPQLNHHHPLHNRHLLSHVPLSHHQRADSPGGSVRHTSASMNTAPMTSSQSLITNHTESPEPFLHLPKEYFFGDVQMSGHSAQNMLTGAQNAASATQVDTAASQQNFVRKLSTSHYTSPQCDSSTADNTVQKLPGIGEPLGSLNTVQSPHMQGGQFNKLASQQTLSPHSTGQVALNPTDSHTDHQPSPGLASVTSGNHFPPPPHTASALSTSPATIIIPGHTTSQPVSSTIGWDHEGGSLNFGPRDLGEMLSQLGLTKYLDKFEQQDVDLQVFLSMTDNDLKELGVKLFGPRKKMTNAIARWHSSAPIASSNLEQAYADKLEAEMQEMAIQLNQ